MLTSATGLANGNLTREQADHAIGEEYQARVGLLEADARAAISSKSIQQGGHVLRWRDSRYGKRGAKGWPLWISLHGGGEVPQAVNDEQWAKHASLYQPENGIYLTPRAPTDTWFMWNEAHVDSLLAALIDVMTVTGDVDPDRIFLLGYSAGGNGTYHLAARMGDRFAAAAAMAGYPSGAPVASFRNLPFGIFVGGHDITFDRVKNAEIWRAELGLKHQDDPKGYFHQVKIYPDLGHGLQGREAEALPWMAGYERNSWPDKIVWVQDAVPHSRFYWLEIEPNEARPGRAIEASVKGQRITIQGDCPDRVTLWLSDRLIDLDLPVEVFANGRRVHQGKIPRTRDSIRRSLAARPDRSSAATAKLDLRNLSNSL